MAKQKNVEQLEGANPETSATETPEVVKPNNITSKKPRSGEPKTATSNKISKKVFYTLGREVAKEDKMASQCSVVYQHICVLCAENGKAERQQLIDSITPGIDGELRTKQGVDRIVAYYIPYLVEAGLIKKETEAVELPTATEPTVQA